VAFEVNPVASAKDKAAFIDFVYEVYSGNPMYRDNLCFTSKNLIYRKDSFAQQCLIEPLFVQEDGRAVARCALVIHPGLDAVQVALFEALPDCRPAVDLLLEAARGFALQHGKDRVVIGINGHNSFGIGFLCDRFDEPNPFDGIYTPGYYIDYFRGRGFAEHPVSTYFVQVTDIDISQRLLDRVYRQFTFRTADLSDLRGEMEVLGALFNETLAGTPFFFARPIEEWYETFFDLKPLLNGENIIYALKDGREVGFLFWHPDYNMVLQRNRKNSTAGFFLRYLLGRRKINQMKINAIGILPEYQRSGVILGLFDQLWQAIAGRYSGGETGFVFDANTASTSICRRFCGSAYKHYVVFEAEAARL